MEAAGCLSIEKELICSTRVSIACAKGKSPQTANADYIVILVPQLSLKLTGNSVKREDLTAPELANQNAMAETAEIGWRKNQIAGLPASTSKSELPLKTTPVGPPAPCPAWGIVTTKGCGAPCALTATPSPL